MSYDRFTLTDEAPVTVPTETGETAELGKGWVLVTETELAKFDKQRWPEEQYDTLRDIIFEMLPDSLTYDRATLAAEQITNYIVENRVADHFALARDKTLPETLYVAIRDVVNGPEYTASEFAELPQGVRYTRFANNQHIRAAYMLLAGAAIHEAYGMHALAVNLRRAVSKTGVNVEGEVLDIVKKQEVQIAQLRRQRNDLLVANNAYLDDARAARAGQSTVELTPPIVEALQRLDQDALGVKIKDYLDNYEFRGDAGDYTPNDDEKVLLEDVLHGFVAQVLEAG